MGHSSGESILKNYQRKHKAKGRYPLHQLLKIDKVLIIFASNVVLLGIWTKKIIGVQIGKAKKWAAWTNIYDLSRLSTKSKNQTVGMLWIKLAKNPKQKTQLLKNFKKYGMSFKVKGNVFKEKNVNQWEVKRSKLTNKCSTAIIFLRFWNFFQLGTLSNVRQKGRRSTCSTTWSTEGWWRTCGWRWWWGRRRWCRHSDKLVKVVCKKNGKDSCKRLTF